MMAMSSVNRITKNWCGRSNLVAMHASEQDTRFWSKENAVVTWLDEYFGEKAYAEPYKLYVHIVFESPA